MRYKIFISYILFSFWFIGHTNAQASGDNLNRAKEIINKVKQFYDTQLSYNIEVDYTLYEDYKSSKTMESYKGVIAKEQESFYTKIHQTETLITPSDFIKVNHEEKAMIYGVSEKEKQQKIAGLNIEELLQNFQKAEIQEEDSLYRIELTSTPITGSPYGTAILEINKKDFSLIRQTLFFLQKVPLQTESGKQRLTNPRLEIVFNNFSIDNTTYRNNFELTSYVVTGKNNNKISGRFKNYQFIDTTRQ
ncbi:hypothetical protein [Aquimarina sp. 2201CG5-10]|uniref:hypothetical protein n=1 Tax=Aquimarina callyspongiae TaxID=3098150 RepID=UPI002AB59770|nr:hypothetical protein [Aquimarina sp. 2201CG5-10]MDY8138482.1 hypothetical protein [Aquimarina sp. 2201CG5-10]